MRTFAGLAVLACCAGVLGTYALAAPEQQTWPWNDKAPVDPALALLSRIDTLEVAITETKKPSLRIRVEAQAPAAGFTEVKLTPRIGDPTNKVFAFDVRGRRPQGGAAQALTPVTIDVEYRDAPLNQVGIVEVYSQETCKAYALKDKTEVACTMNPGSQQAP